MSEQLSFLQDAFKSCDDVTFKMFLIGNMNSYLIYSSNLVNKQRAFEIEQDLAAFLIGNTEWNGTSRMNIQTKDSFITQMCKHLIFSEKIELNDTTLMVNQILSGQTILMVEEINVVFLLPSQYSAGRSIEESETEQVIRGPREGFVESIDTNVMLIRRKIKTPSLKIEYLTVGRQTQTKLAVVYLKGVADDALVDEAHNRLSRLEIDGILESSYIESMIEDAPLSPFPTIFNTERPDRLCAGLLEGKVAILTDGTPFALTMPAVFVEFLQSNDDYYNGSFLSSIARWIRALGMLVALLLPAFFVATLTIHQELLQPPFLIRIASNRADLPYPVVIESIFAIIAFELLREAGQRMPRRFQGLLITLLGILIIGQMVIQAGLAAPLTIIVIAVASLTTFIVPNYAFQQVIRYLSLLMLLLASFFGYMGILIGLMLMLTHLINLRSFGAPYLAPISPARKEGWKDVFLRAPRWAMEMRNPALGGSNVRRSGDDNFPKPPIHGVKENQDENE
ncbi:MAG: spore germination protein [Sporomusaceae bacterium]|nr:spore germination protein [Sporomusaceae bacterium]